MENENRAKGHHSLIPLEDFKALLGVDDREDNISIFCLTAATYSIEQYCERRLFLKRHIEWIEATSDLLLPLREYPVREILGVYGFKTFNGNGELLEPDLYQLFPELVDETGEDFDDIVSNIVLSPVLKPRWGYEFYKVFYHAGYCCGEARPDLASACLELAAWNMVRYRSRRIGITGNVRGSGKEGEHLEASMPENVKLLLEPYKRRVI